MGIKLDSLVTVAERRIAIANGSMKMANNKGESGHPCLVPLSRMKLCDLIPFVVTVALGELYRAEIH